MEITNILFRSARRDEANSIHCFITTHGQNEWNYLAEPDLTEHLNGIATGATHGVVAELNQNLIGVATCLQQTHSFAEPSGSANAPGIISEVVVAKEHCGKGIGTALLKQCIAHFSGREVREIYVERHADNAASAGMMRKAGFEVIRTFHDPGRRQSGSRQTSVLRYPGDPRTDSRKS